MTSRGGKVIIIAIDPGIRGGVARLDTEAKVRSSLNFYTIPVPVDGKWDPWLLTQEVLAWRLAGAQKVVIEQCHAFPGNQAYTSAKVMEGYGMMLAAIAGSFAKQDTLIAPASVWKKDMGITVPIVKAGLRATEQEKKLAYKARKVRAVEVAEEMFNRSFVTPRGRLMDGEAEACLLAKYAEKLWTRPAVQ
jgi:hypothetical protein